MSSPPKRLLTVAAAQMGPNREDAPRGQTLSRMLTLLRSAAAQGARLVVFPELALTTFFPRRLITDPEEVASFFEPESSSAPHAVVDSPHAAPLFDAARELGVDVSFGYAERWTDEETGRVTCYNTSIYFSAREGGDGRGRVLAKYRKVHLPGMVDPLPDANAAQQLEKRYFSPGNLGFQAFRAPGLVEGALKAEDVSSSASGTKEPYDGRGDPIIGMMICNDRRWAEAWRCYGLQGVELVLEGYNTTDYKPQDPGSPEEQEALALIHHRIGCQSGSYTNACFSINVAKAGVEADGPGGGLIGGSIIYGPDGLAIAEAKTKGDELLVATLDLSLCRRGKEKMFCFEKHRRVEHYARLVEQVGVIEPPLLSR